MFSSPFPNNISFFCGGLSLTKELNLLSEEKKIVESFDSQKRKNEFMMGRKVAHLALKRFELESIPILRNHKTREPCWPKSVFGSITHSGGLAAAAVGLNKDISGIGIDLEDLSRKINFKISRQICIDDELKWLKKLSPEQANLNLRIIFSAKESIFKCFFPVSRKYLNFKDAYVKINEKKSEFSFILSNACSNITDVGYINRGLFKVKDDFLLTSTYIKNIIDWGPLFNLSVKTNFVSTNIIQKLIKIQLMKKICLLLKHISIVHKQILLGFMVNFGRLLFVNIFSTFFRHV